jgi:hypothetical protein
MYSTKIIYFYNATQLPRRKKMSIKLSQQHGVNPSLICCVWCGESKGVALVGRLPNDAKAPDKIIENYEPCDKCLEIFSQGVLIVETTDTPPFPNAPPIGKGEGIDRYPTGRHAVVRPEAIYELIDDKAIADGVVASGRAIVSTETYNTIIPQE